LEVIWADSKYHNHGLHEWIATESRGTWRLEVVRRPEGSKGLVLLPKRWVVERTFGWLNRSRRLSKDFEALPETTETWIRIAMIHLMVRRLAAGA
jgi:putative transposase